MKINARAVITLELNHKEATALRNFLGGTSKALALNAGLTDEQYDMTRGIYKLLNGLGKLEEHLDELDDCGILPEEQV